MTKKLISCKKFFHVCLVCSMAMILTGCGEGVSKEAGQVGNTNSSVSRASKNETVYAKNIGYQLEKPEINEEIAIMNIKNYGKIYIRFFEEECPKAVQNFKTLSRQGYYNGTIFHRVVENFMIQGGDPKGDGTGGQSAFGEKFEDEFCNYLFNITGAVAMANSGKNTNGSQFFINDVNPKTTVYSGNSRDEKVINFYKEHGGNSHLDGLHTVFGQVFSGMDVVDKISKTDINSENSKPTEDVVISSITIEGYDGKIGS